MGRKTSRRRAKHTPGATRKNRTAGVSQLGIRLSQRALSRIAGTKKADEIDAVVSAAVAQLMGAPGSQEVKRQARRKRALEASSPANSHERLVHERDGAL